MTEYENASGINGENTYCRGFRRGLEACKDIGECFEGWIFDIQLLRHVLDILWPVRRVLHLDIRVRLSIDFRLMCMNIRVRLGLDMTYLSRLRLRLLLLGLEPPQLVLGLDFAVGLDTIDPIDCVRRNIDFGSHVCTGVNFLWTGLVSVLSSEQPADNVAGEQESWMT